MRYPLAQKQIILIVPYIFEVGNLCHPYSYRNCFSYTLYKLVPKNSSEE